MIPSTEISPEIARLPQPMTPPMERRLTPNFESAYICSVFPLARQIKLPRMVYVGVSPDYPDGYTRLFTYYLPAAKPGSYSVLEVTPPMHLLRSPMAAQADADQRTAESRIARPDTATNEALSLIQCWSGNFSQAGGNRPGIGLIRGPEPTADELAELHRLQREFCRYFVNEADGFWYQGKRERIKMGGLHQMSAAYMGIKNDPNHPWTSDMTSAFKACVACGENIIATAFVCKHCNRDVFEFAMARNLDLETIRFSDPKLADMVEAARAKQGVPEPASAKPTASEPVAPRRRPMPAFDKQNNDE
jgi:hypothetical protein